MKLLFSKKNKDKPLNTVGLGELPSTRSRISMPKLKPLTIKNPKEQKPKEKSAAPRRSRSLKRYEVLTKAEDLRNLSSRKILVSGQVVKAALTARQVEEKGFYSQPPRIAEGGLLASTGLNKKANKLFLSIDSRIIDNANVRVAFAVDSYLAWGIKHRKGTLVLVGGIEKQDGYLHVDILTFHDGRLVEIVDRELPEMNDPMFRSAVDSVIGDIRAKFPRARFVQAAPLSDWGIPGIEYIGEKALKQLRFQPLVRKGNSHTAFMLPAGAALVSVAGIGAVIANGWAEYASAQSRYEQISNSPLIKKVGGVDNNYINVMTQRRHFMEQPRRQDVLPTKAMDIVKGIGIVPNIQIVEMKLPAPMLNAPREQIGIVIQPTDKQKPALITTDRVPDAWIRISVPRTPASGIEQAKEVMMNIANGTGMSLRLAHQGIQDENNRRTFTLEGFIHG